MHEDQRRCPRISLDVVVNCSTRAIAHSKDISEGGICLITEEPMTLGKIFTLEFSLPGEPAKVQLFGKVAWTRPAGANHHENGITFWDVDPKNGMRVTKFLRNEI
ncbi:MAG TPA: PilZ domain-containing protein [Spirochaetia bacterium]|nr:PilZ domain-containing protein [Spirochaetia bacterium]